MTVSRQESDAEPAGTEARINASLEELRRDLKLLHSEITTERRHRTRSMILTMAAMAGLGMLIGVLAFGGNRFGAEFEMTASAYNKPRKPVASPKKFRKRPRRYFEI